MMVEKLRLFALLPLVSILISCGNNEKPIIYAENSCAVDRIDGAVRDSGLQYAVNIGNTINIWGWVADTRAGKTPNRVTVSLLSIGGAAFNLGSGEVGAKRPDVATAFSNPALQNAGFRVEAIASMPPESYAIQLVADYGNKIMVCSPNAFLKIR